VTILPGRVTFGSDPGSLPAAYGDTRRWQRCLPLNRWVLRVAAYVALTDRYPPFQLDIGGTDPGSALSLGATPEPCDVR
jgi:hypothetical protein